MDPEYLGDGLYVDHDGYQVRLYADSDGRRHEVFMEPDVIERFMDYLAQLAAKG